MSISKVDITTKNLNLLHILHALIETGNGTAAAKRLRMSQPNLSRALRLLRDEFGDPLFVRNTRGLTPTKRALEIYGPLKELVKSLENIYTRPEFDIKQAKGKFTIGATDYIEFLFAPALSKVLGKEAPGITVNFRPTGGYLPKADMENGACDLTLLVVRETIPPNFYRQSLFEDPYLCAVRKKHPILSSKITIDRLTEFGHVLINPQGTLWSVTDAQLEKLKKRRQIVLGTPNALSAVAAVAKSDLILTATQRFIERTQEFFPVETFKALFEIDPIPVASIWHERSQSDPIHQWMRAKIKELAEAL